MFTDCVIRFLLLWTEFLVKCISLISSTVFLRICQQDHQCNQVGGIRAVLAWNETFECVHRYFSYAANCSSLILLTVFLLPCQLYFYYPVNCISLILPTVFLLSCQLYFSCPANRISLILNATGLLIIGQYFSYSTRCICQFYRLYFFDSVNLIISVIKQACLLGMTRDIWMR